MRNLVGRLVLRGWRAWRRLVPVPVKPRSEPRRPTGDTPRRPHVLVVTPMSIHPVIHGAAVRISNLIRRLAPSTRVTLLVLGEGTDDPGQRRAYRPFCDRVLFHRLPRPTGPVTDPLGLLPPSATPFSHRVISDRISALVDAHAVDIVQLEFAELGAHINREDNARTVLTEHDLGFETQERQRALDVADRFDAAARIGADTLDGVRQERFEVLACAAADQVHCMSENDRDLLASRLASDTHLRVIPNGVDTEVYRPAPGSPRHGVLFLGSFPHLPNRDAFELLIEEIWPEIRRRSPDATLTVAGARPPESVLAVDGRDGIRVVGEVGEVAPLYRQHRVLIVPLRAGSGTRLKILEALASGLPVVSTTIGAEGLAFTDPPEVVVADDPVGMARAVVELLTADDETIDEMGRRGRDLVTARYDWDSIAEDLIEAHAGLTEPGGPAGALTAVAIDEPSGEPDPTVSVVVPTTGDTGLGRGLLDGLADQRLDHPFEVIAVDHQSPEATLDRWRARGVRVVAVNGPKFNLGAALNAGAAAARGRILVFAAPGVVPADRTWLAQLVAPFDRDQPPAAVQGGITTQLGDGAPPHDPGFTRESARWRAAHNDLSFSVVNAAVRRELWQQFPFPPYRSLADLAWQRIAADHELLILPCLAAAVRHVVPPDAGVVWRASRDEGRMWRRLGERTTVADLWIDLRQPRPCLTAEGRPAPAATRGHRVFAVIRPLGLFLGNRFGRS